MATSAMKEFFRLMRDINKFTDGQAEVYLGDDENHAENETEDEENDNPLTFFLVVKPNEGYYEGGRIKFKVALEDYPTNPPNVTCCDVIYHPNIDLTDEGSYGSVCVNLLGSDWTPEVGLDGCVMAILFLFYNPQLDDALSPVFSGSDECDDLEEFAENVKISMRGGEIDGYTFDNIMINECEEEKENGEKKPSEGEGECCGIISTENIKVSTLGEDLDTNNHALEKDVEDEAEKENQVKSVDENGEELDNTSFLEPIKDNYGGVSNLVDVESTSDTEQNHDVQSTNTNVENAMSRTSHGQETDPLGPCDAADNKTTDSHDTDNDSVSQSKTDVVADVQGLETDHDKLNHRQSIVKYIKSKMNVFSGFFKLINQCKGVMQKR